MYSRVLNTFGVVESFTEIFFISWLHKTFESAGVFWIICTRVHFNVYYLFCLVQILYILCDQGSYRLWHWWVTEHYDMKVELLKRVRVSDEAVFKNNLHLFLLP